MNLEYNPNIKQNLKDFELVALFFARMRLIPILNCSVNYFYNNYNRRKYILPNHVFGYLL